MSGKRKLFKNQTKMIKFDEFLKEIESDLKADALDFEKSVFKWNLFVPPLCVLLILLLRVTRGFLFRRQRI